MKPLKLTRGQAKQAVGIMRAELRARLGFHLDVENVYLHAVARDAIVAKLQGQAPRDECDCGGLLRLDGTCRDCNARKERP